MPLCIWSRKHSLHSHRQLVLHVKPCSVRVQGVECRLEAVPVDSLAKVGLKLLVHVAPLVGVEPEGLHLESVEVVGGQLGQDLLVQCAAAH